jgi:hypothetical protein
MNPIAIIALAASLVAGIGLALTAKPELDTAGWCPSPRSTPLAPWAWNHSQTRQKAITAS